MKTIIAGSGKVGAILARKLVAENYDVTVIDTDSGTLQLVQEQNDVMTVSGNCAITGVLSEADVEGSDLLIATSGSDETNLLCCLTAHTMNPDIHTIARIKNPEYISQIYDMRETFALSMIITPERRAAVEIERLLRYPGFLKLDTFAKGRVEIVELRIESDSKLKDKPLSQLNSIIKCKVLVCIVLRDGNAITPYGDFVLREGDRIFVTASTDDLTTLLKNLGIITRKVKHVIVCGASRICHYLCEKLVRSGIGVTVIDNDKEKCRQLSAMHPDVNVVEGDASSSFTLEREGVDRCDALIALTGMDELNIIISLYGHSHKVPQIITKLDHVDDNAILDFLPQSSVICPKELCGDLIVGYVRAMEKQAGAARAVHSIADGKAEAIEFRVDGTTHHTSEPLKHIKVRKNVIIACIMRKGKTVIPNGDTEFYPGDTMIVVTKSGDTVYQLNDIFE